MKFLTVLLFLIASAFGQGAKPLPYGASSVALKDTMLNIVIDTPIIYSKGIGSFTKLHTIITSIGSANVRLVMDKQLSIDSNLTIPINIELDMVSGGGSFNIAASKTLTFYNIRAGPRRIFYGSGTALPKAGSCEYVLSEWWGALNDGSADAATAINTALTQARGEVGWVRLLGGTYVCNSPITIPARNIKFTGVHGGGTVLRFNTSTFQTFIEISTLGDGWVQISDMEIDGGSSKLTSKCKYIIHAVNMNQSSLLTNLSLNNSLGFIKIESGYLSTLENIDMRAANYAAVDSAGITQAQWDSVYGTNHAPIDLQGMNACRVNFHAYQIASKVQGGETGFATMYTSGTVAMNMEALNFEWTLINWDTLSNGIRLRTQNVIYMNNTVANILSLNMESMRGTTAVTTKGSESHVTIVGVSDYLNYFTGDRFVVESGHDQIIDNYHAYDSRGAGGVFKNTASGISNGQGWLVRSASMATGERKTDTTVNSDNDNVYDTYNFTTTEKLGMADGADRTYSAAHIFTPKILTGYAVTSGSNPVYKTISSGLSAGSYIQVSPGAFMLESGQIVDDKKGTASFSTSALQVIYRTRPYTASKHYRVFVGAAGQAYLVQYNAAQTTSPEGNWIAQFATDANDSIVKESDGSAGVDNNPRVATWDGEYIPNTTQIIIRATTAPTTGYWLKGSVTINSAPSVGDPLGWICTTAGTPGTWTATYNPTNINGLFTIDPTTGAVLTGTWTGAAINETHGGTNQTSYTTGNILYASAANTLSKLAPNTTATVKYLKMVSSVPSWDTVITGPGGITGLANPSASIGKTAVNGSATTGMRSDAAPLFDSTVNRGWSASNRFYDTVFTKKWMQDSARNNPGTPASGYGAVWFDSTYKILYGKDDAAALSHFGKTTAATASNWFTAFNADGTFTKAQPAFTDISGAILTAQITNSNVTLPKIANQADLTILGNNIGAPGPPLALTAAQTRTLLSLVIGTNVQAWDADLDALAGLTSAANKGIYFTGSGTAGVYDLTADARTLLDNTVAIGDLPYGSAANVWSQLAGNATGTKKFLTMTSSVPGWNAIIAGDIPDLSATYQPLDATLTALAGLATGADKLAYSTGTDAFSQVSFTAAARTFTALSATAGDLPYASATNTWAGLAANGTATNKFLTQVSGGAPGWNAIVTGDINALVNTWAGIQTFTLGAVFSSTSSHADDIFFSADAKSVRTNTADAADNKRIFLCGGGACNDATRGAFLTLGGNENGSSTGEAYLGAGDVAGGTIRMGMRDNQANAFSVEETSARRYINVTTTNGSEAIAFGNSSTNPTGTWPGSGSFTWSGTNIFVTPTTSLASARFPAGTAPSSPTIGDIFQDATQKALTFYGDGGIVKYLTGQIWTNGGVTKSYSNSTTETSIWPTGIGTKTLPANCLLAGKTMDVYAAGNFSTTLAPTLTLKLKFGSTVIATTGAVTTASGVSNALFKCNIQVIDSLAGASGKIWAQGDCMIGTIYAPMVSTASSTVNTTTTQAVDFTATWGSASLLDSLMLTNATIRLSQ